MTNIWSPVDNKYKVLKTLGSGVYGEVVQAQHLESGELYAIKRIDKVCGQKSLFKKVLREIQIMKQFSNMKNNIFTTKLYEIIFHENENFDSIFLVMNYLKTDMKKMSSSKNLNFSENHMKVIFYNLLCSINYIHSANVMHRDLKPANILVGTYGEVIICDFGLARTLPKECCNRSLSRHVQTRWYRSPEVILGNRDYDNKVDMWSIGCILGELVCLSQYQPTEKGKIAMFRGNSCYPLSPNQNGDKCIQLQKQDQMIKILNVVDKETQNFEFINQSQNREYAQKLMTKYGGKSSLEQQYPDTPINIIELLKSLLVLDPENRVSAKECLKNKLFDDIRNPKLEQGAPHKFYLKCDELTGENLDQIKMRNIIQAEIKKYNQ